MTKLEFLKTHTEDLKKFLSTPCGQNFMGVLSQGRPPAEFPKEEHLLIENRGAIRGYELCIFTIAALTRPIPQTPEVDANYGVPDRKPEEK